MPFYASPEQLMRERSELARKGISRGRSVVVLTYTDGVLFVAENASSTLHKISEIYDRIGFAAAGKYNEFENLRRAGIRHTDVTGYQYDRRDVSARALANLYAQALGTIFTEQLKPYEVELCVAEVGDAVSDDRLYRLTYDGSVVDEPKFVVMGGQADTVTTSLKDAYETGMTLAQAVSVAVKALSASSSSAGNGKSLLGASSLEVAVLERHRPRRAFRRLVGAALDAVLPSTDKPADDKADKDTTGDAATTDSADGSTSDGAQPEADGSSGDTDSAS